MKAKIVTAVTTYVDITTMMPEHEVALECEDELPRSVVIATAQGGLKSALRALGVDEPEWSDLEASIAEEIDLGGDASSVLTTVREWLQTNA